MRNLQLERQAVNTRAILDFTVGRMPELPDSVTRRFPELKTTVQDFDKLRSNLQMQLREQFVAIREMLDKIVTNDTFTFTRQEITNEIKKVENKITNIQQIFVGQIPGKATAQESGLVKTDVTNGDPVVYLKTSIDDLLTTLTAIISARLNALDVQVAQLFVFFNTINAMLAPTIILTTPGDDPNALGINGVEGLATQVCVNTYDERAWFWVDSTVKWKPLS